MACARGMPMHAMETPLGETNGQRGLVTWVHDQGLRVARHHASCKSFAADNPVARHGRQGTHWRHAKATQAKHRR